MKSFIYLFNPDNDMALAADSPYYQTPADIRRMTADLSALPAWIASEGDAVHTEAPAETGEWFLRNVPEEVRPMVEFTDCWPDRPYRPWGWNPSLIYRMRQSGVSENFLPSEAGMKRIRQLSGRDHYAGLLSALQDIPGTCGRSEICSSVEEVLRFASENGGECILKSPWSGSGRGVVRLNPAAASPSVMGWIGRILRTQGCIMAEPVYRRTADFAMEFYADGENVSFVGYSWFETDAQGHYKANRILPDALLKPVRDLKKHERVLDELRGRLLSFFGEELRGVYKGYFGVDMMLCVDEQGMSRIHPLVEVNLRTNMGIVTCLFCNRCVHPSASGHYVVECYRADGEALRFDEQMREQHPIRLDGGRLLSGYLSLTPIFRHTRYHAYVLCDAP